MNNANAPIRNPESIANAADEVNAVGSRLVHQTIIINKYLRALIPEGILTFSVGESSITLFMKTEEENIAVIVDEECGILMDGLERDEEEELRDLLS